jgi:uncharacterized repeat protein (TIGR03809 family)
MTSQLDEAKGREIVARWCNLAEQRLEYLTELFDSGRWRRFYGEQAFLKDVREARIAVDTWRELLSREASPDNRPIDLTWLGRGQTRVPKNDFRRDPAPLPRVAEIPIVPPKEIVSILAADGDAVSETRSTEALSADAVAAVLDLASVAARYPVLRNTL